MELKDFLTLEYVLSFPGMVFVCALVVQVIKGLVDKALNQPRTMWVVFVTAIVLVGFKTLLEAQTIENLNLITILSLILMWILNACAVWLASMKGYELVAKK